MVAQSAFSNKDFRHTAPARICAHLRPEPFRHLDP
jgi:hypothetical protein